MLGTQWIVIACQAADQIAAKENSMPRILVVDDSPTMRNLVKSLLTAEGMDVFTASDGIEGLEEFSKCDPDLVVADVNMPRLNGVKMISAIRSGATNSGVPIVVLTTETSGEVKDQLRAAGASAWVAKPYEEAGFVKIIKQFLH